VRDRESLHGASIKELAAVVELPDLDSIRIRAYTQGYEAIVYDVLLLLKLRGDFGIMPLGLLVLLAGIENATPNPTNSRSQSNPNIEPE
jgi:hypothetical protein